MITVSNLCKTYFAKKEEPVLALNQVSLCLENTGLVSIVGPSGCGKTTLLNILGGLDSASSGTVIYNGVNIDAFSDSDWDLYRANNLGFVFQAYNLIDDLSVKKNLELPLLLESVGVKNLPERIEVLAEKFGMVEMLSKKVKHLSGGQKQRVAILRAIVKEPTIILADEPTGNLDRDNSRLVYELLKDISKSCLVIVVSHDRELSEEYSDRIIELSYGEIVKDSLKGEREERNYRGECCRKEGGMAALPFSFCVSLVLDSFKARFVRFTIALFMMAITMTLILLFTLCVFNNREGILSKYIKSKNKEMNYVYLPVDGTYAGYLGNNSKQIYSGIELNELLNKCIGEEHVVFVNDYATAEYKDNADEITLLGTNTFPESIREYKLVDNQVIINRSFASKINVTEQNLPMGLKVNDLDVQIVGIVDYELIDKKQYIFWGNKSLWLKISQQYIDEVKGIDIVEAGGTNEIAECIVSMGSIDSYDGTLIVGHLPINENEIAVSQTYISSRGRSIESVLGRGFYTYNLRDNKYGNSYYDIINLWDIVGEKMIVTGVVDGDYDYYFNDNAYNSIIEKARYYQGKLAFICDKNELHRTISAIDKSGVRIDDENLNDLYTVWDEMDEMMLYFLLGILTMGVLTLLQMISTFSYSIKDSEHKIGIFRSLGVPQKSVNMMFILESVTITILAEFIASGGAVFLIWKINQHYKDTLFRVASMDLILPKVSIWFLCLGAILLLYNIVVLIPLRRIKKRKVVDLLLGE